MGGGSSSFYKREIGGCLLENASSHALHLVFHNLEVTSTFTRRHLSDSVRIEPGETRYIDNYNGMALIGSAYEGGMSDLFLHRMPSREYEESLDEIRERSNVYLAKVGAPVAISQLGEMVRGNGLMTNGWLCSSTTATYGMRVTFSDRGEEGVIKKPICDL